MAKIAKQNNSIRAGTTIFRAFLVAALVAVSLVGGGMFVYGKTLSGRIHPGVTIAGINVSELTAGEATSVIQQVLDRYEQDSISVVVGTRRFAPAFAELGVQFDVQSSLEQALSVGRTNAFAENFAVPFTDGENIPLAVLVDDAQLDAYTTMIQEAHSLPATNSELVMRDGEPTPTASQTGVSYSSTITPQAIQQTVRQLTPLTIEFSATPVLPLLAEQDFITEKDQLATFTNTPAILRFEGAAYTVTSEQLQDSLRYTLNPSSIDDPTLPKAVIAVNEEAWTNALTPIAEQIRVEPKPTFSFVAEEYGEYAFKNSEGRQLDMSLTAERLLDAFANGERAADLAVETVLPDAEILNVEAPKKEGKVITVDLSRQSLFAFEDGTLKFWTRVSTGKGAYRTPTGEWTVYTKTRRQVMQGPGYYLPNVEYVMPYNGDYTLHGAYWHTNFGHPMSHGCTNISNTDAKWLYEWAEVGTPVVIYES